MPDIKNDYRNFSRVVVTTEDDATIYVNFLLPKDPEIMIINSTAHPIYLKQVGGNEQICVLGNSRMPYAYENQTAPGKKIHVESQGHSYTYNFDKIKPECKPLGNYKVSLKVSTEGITKEFRVFDPDREKTGPGINLLQLMSIKKEKEEPAKMEANCRMPGFSISMIDETPKERILITLFGIETKIEYETKPDDKFIETILGFELKVNHMQVDNMFCRGAEFAVIMCPKKLRGAWGVDDEEETEQTEGDKGEDEEIVPWL